MARRLLPVPLLALALLLSSAASAAGAATERIATEGPAAGDPAAQSPRAVLRKARAAVIDGRGVRTGSEVTPLLKELALKLPALRGAARERALRLLQRPTRGQGTDGDLEYRVNEQPPVCSAHFCIHYVRTTSDAPPLADGNHNGVPNYVETMSSVFEHVYAVENAGLGWRAPKSDGSRGCIKGAPSNCPDKTDVYISDVASQGIYGYAAPDPGQRGISKFAYLVLDDDYSSAQFPQYAGDPLRPMEVTAAHEYNHVLQFAYDTAQETWVFESTATWMEDYVYTDVNDYLQYVKPWATMTSVPLTYFPLNSDDPRSLKAYGDAVWNRWIEGRYGPDPIRDVWPLSRTIARKSFGPGAYNASLNKRGTSFSDAFATFAADTAEWRTSSSPFAEGSTFPDVRRTTTGNPRRPLVLTPDVNAAGGRLNHTAFALLDVRPPSDMARLKLVLSTPRGTRMAIALIGRTGGVVNGTVTRFLRLLPTGGPGVITIDDPGRYDRLTAAVINADASARRFFGDWIYLRDGQPINARVSADFRAPSVRSRRPLRGTHRASLGARVTVAFSEAMYGITSRTVKLVARNGRAVKARLTLTADGRRTSQIDGADKVVVKPVRKLRPRTRYAVRLSRDLRDFGGNPLPASALTWSFVTKR